MRRSLVWLLAFLALGSASALAGPASVDLLTVGAAIRASHGMIFDRQNRLYVASVLGRSITVLDPDSGVILARIGPEQGVETPDDVAFTPDGALYWTAIVPGEIGKLSARGEFSHQFVAFSLNSVATSQGGRVFASQCAFQGGSGLFELDPALLAPPRLITDALGEACGLNGMAVGPDGLLYGPRSANGDVVRVNPESGAFSVVATGFAVPSAVKFDSRGRLWVTDLGAGTLDRVDPQTGQKTRIVTLAPGLDSLAIDRRDRVFVSSNVTGEVAEVKSDGSVRVVRHGGLTAPGGLALLPRADGESLFVADLSGLEELDSASGAVRSIAGATFRAAIQDPITVARDGANLILSSWSAGNVQVWDPRTQTVLEDHAGQLGLPLYALRFGGDLVVSELLSGSVLRLPAASPGAPEPLASGFFVPAGLAATATELYLGDWATGVIWQLAAGGQVLAEPRAVAGGLVGPEGMAVDLDGSLLVVETGTGRLLRIDPATGETSTVVSGLQVGVQAPETVAAPTVFWSDVAVSPSGALFVSGDLDNVVYRIRPGSPCVPDEHHLCLANGRFRVEARTLSLAGQVAGQAVAQPILGLDPSVPSGLLLLPEPARGQIFVKVFDGCAQGASHFVVFASSLSRDEEYLQITDTATGALLRYAKPLGQRVGLFVDGTSLPCAASP